MKISINIDEQVRDTEIQISCRQLTPEIEKILSTLRILDKQLMVSKDEATYILDVAKVIYIESIDRKTFIYTKDAVYESTFKLYELEQQLEDFSFVRVSKSCMIQLRCIKALRAELDRKIRLTMDNNEEIVVSRQYAEELRRRLGVK